MSALPGGFVAFRPSNGRSVVGLLVVSGWPRSVVVIISPTPLPFSFRRTIQSDAPKLPQTPSYQEQVEVAVYLSKSVVKSIRGQEVRGTRDKGQDVRE